MPDAADQPAGVRPPGPLLGSGRSADVYAFGADRVLRRYRNGGDIAAEAAAMRYAHAHGYPVPAVRHAAGTDLVLERVDGPTLLAALAGGTVAAEPAGRMLAGLHRRLHRLPPRTPAAPRLRLLHRDLHPDNVIVHPRRGPVVIDWCNATDGPPALDRALTALIMAEAVVGSHVPAGLRPVAYRLLVTFLADAGPGGQLAAAVAVRSADPALAPAEVARVRAAAALVGRLTAPGPRG